MIAALVIVVVSLSAALIALDQLILWADREMTREEDRSAS